MIGPAGDWCRVLTKGQSPSLLRPVLLMQRLLLQAKDEADHQTNWFGQRKEEADDQADRAGNYVSRKSRDASNEANHQANKYTSL